MASAPARAALAGNPSDGYGGATLALTLPAYSAHAELAKAAIEPSNPLVAATVARFARQFAQPARGIRWRTTIPREVGLGGSSALVIATLRALCEGAGVTLAPTELAELALAVEVEDLGIAAGLQDRVVQAFGGLVFMDFATHRHERLDEELLPPLVVAHRPDAHGASGAVHGDLRSRFQAGEPGLRDAIATLARHAHEARDALLAQDHAGFARAVDATYDARAEIISLDPRHVAMIACTREQGAAANYSGSGGAIVAVCADETQRRAVRTALERLGCETL